MCMCVCRVYIAHVCVCRVCIAHACVCRLYIAGYVCRAYITFSPRRVDEAFSAEYVHIIYIYIYIIDYTHIIICV